MTGVRELVQVRVVPAAPEHVRLSLLGGRTQLDVSLPLDAPVASLVPELVKLVRSRDAAPSGQAEDTMSREAKRRVWVLSRAADGEPLSPDVSLREAGITNGALLKLTAERALTAPTLYDDVVDAAARLNKAAYAGWDAVAAKWMAFAGVHLVALAWLYFLVSDVFRPHRSVLVGLAVVAALALVGAAAWAHRSHGETAVGAALGWAAIPITAGIAWGLLVGFGGWGLAAGCGALVVILLGVYRAVGTGHFGYLAATVFFGFGGLALVVHQVGVRAELVGCSLAVAATVGCLAVPRMTAPTRRFAPPSDQAETEDDLFEHPYGMTAPSGSAETADAPRGSTPTAEGVWDRVRSATATRAALYTGLGCAASVGAGVVLAVQAPAHWSGLAFALTVAATLGLYVRRPGTVFERAALTVPAVSLGVFTCWAVQGGHEPIPLVAFGVLLALAATTGVVGMTLADDGVSRRTTTLLAYFEYAASMALIPIALWVAGVYSRLDIW